MRVNRWYRWRVRSDGEWSEWTKWHTNDQGPTTMFAYPGDTLAVDTALNILGAGVVTRIEIEETFDFDSAETPSAPDTKPRTPWSRLAQRSAEHDITV